MINVNDLISYFKEKNIDFFCGVPDSQLSSFCDYIEENCENIIAANEGNAVGIASGYHLTTNNIPVIYLQNSGLGNIVNPVTSLTHQKVYSIPIIYVIGWRGQPGVHDEPQHKKQGEITLDLLELLDIDHVIINKESTIDELKKTFENQFLSKLSSGKSVAIVVSKGSFENYELKKSNDNNLTRENAIKTVTSFLNDDDIIISTTGKSSRELFEYRESMNQGHGSDFLTVGSMGHSSSIALGIALNNQNKRIFCYDGDGAVLMHMGSLALIGSKNPNNFYHIMFNNSAHESVGGLPTIMNDIDIKSLVKSTGYKKVFNASTIDELKNVLEDFTKSEGPVFLNINVNIESRKDLGRPTTTPIENKNDFMKKLKGE
ncbi:phosphonopyruvate decarboxylase [Methanobrevibacter gottschalkii]|uniref:sulfopyruvate decarboxylase n=1 Tax=Methanobrevibacter gottschalkii TaxID=190974 RepID=A0A1H7NF62_9EURY|nr:phosphonopyruvate decarboxylase [Methanobrevibacter gottschalkii]SEL22202.1 phosphonopyruvate decarboxylase [Methanobrevibacter gottschalkii]